MKIKLLSDWVYTPDFMDNKKQPDDEQLKIKFHPLSGKEEIKSVGNGSDSGIMLAAAIVGIKNPIILVGPDGKERECTPEDFSSEPALKGLFYELLGEYSRTVNLAADDAENLK